jgi:hypothetical protein
MNAEVKYLDEEPVEEPTAAIPDGSTATHEQNHQRLEELIEQALNGAGTEVFDQIVEIEEQDPGSVEPDMQVILNSLDNSKF